MAPSRCLAFGSTANNRLRGVRVPGRVLRAVNLSVNFAAIAVYSILGKYRFNCLTKNFKLPFGISVFNIVFQVNYRMNEQPKHEVFWTDTEAARQREVRNSYSRDLLSGKRE